MIPVVLTSSLFAGIGIVGFVFTIFGPAVRDSERGRPARSLNIKRAIERVLPSAIAAFVVLLVTRWPSAALFGGLAVFFAPKVVGRTSAAVAIDQVEAIALWTELLRDTLSASAGIGEAIMVTAPVSPSAIRGKVVRLADRLASGVSMADALRAFASEVNDPTCDMVACALLLAAGARTQRLADLLTALSETIRDDVAMRLRIEANRASSRNGVRTIVVFSVCFVAALLIIAHSYLAPFGTPIGQLVLAVVGTCYASGIGVMLRLIRPRPQGRLLSSTELRTLRISGGE